MTKTKSLEPEESAMGFKDKQKALDTLKYLDGRDTSYQYHVITSFVSRVKRTLQITKDEEKLNNLRDALKIFEDWLVDYKENNRAKENLAYLPIDVIKGFRVLAKRYDVLDDDFYEAYAKEKGDYKNLRGVKVKENEGTTWDIERNRRLKEIIAQIKEKNIQWYETDVGDFRGLPTREHTRCIMLGYSPDPTKLRKLMSEVEERMGPMEDTEMAVDEDEKKSKKRNHEESSSDENGNEEPEKKVLKVSKDTTEEAEKGEEGLGFKDKEKALRSIELLEGRDVTYQYHAISGLVKRAQRVISCTKDENKIARMREAVEVLEKWITDYNVNGRAKENLNYLSLEIMKSFEPLTEKYGIEDRDFLKAYEEVEGDYKKLRSVQVPESDLTWDRKRNKVLGELVNRMKEENVSWFEEDGELRGLPSKDHTLCIMWAYSPDPGKLKKLAPTIKDKLTISQ